MTKEQQEKVMELLKAAGVKCERDRDWGSHDMDNNYLVIATEVEPG